MQSICSALALTVLVAANVLAQPIAPTVRITCTVNYEFVQSYARDSKNVPKLLRQGANFSGNGFFVTRRSIDLYPQRTEPSNSYKVTLDAAMHSFSSRACKEDIVPVMRYIDSHTFETTQNVFYLGQSGDPLPSKAIERKIGRWNLGSWNNQVDPRVD